MGQGSGNNAFHDLEHKCLFRLGWGLLGLYVRNGNDEETKNEKYAGAYVKEPIPGKYDWVVSFDLNSLYPHLIMQYNISPETFVRDVGFKPSIDDIIEGLYNDDTMKEFMHKHNVTACGSFYRVFLGAVLVAAALTNENIRKRIIGSI